MIQSQDIVCVSSDLGTRRRTEDPLQQPYQELKRRVEELSATLLRSNERLRREITLRERTERALRESEKTWGKYAFIANASKEFMTLISKDHVYEAVNESFCQAHGKSREEIVGCTVADIWGEERYSTQIKQHLDKCFAHNEVHYQDRFEFADLGLRYFDVAYYPYCDDDGTITHAVVVSRDITQRKVAKEENERIQAQLIQAQKMEAIGLLAGGVAHDFNNLVTIIQGYVDLALKKIDETDSLYSDLTEIQLAATRAANLTHQLLLFSRKQPIEFAPLDVNRTIEDLLRMLNCLFGADIVISADLDPELHKVRGNSGNIEQVIMNLAVNARDAMPEGGRLTLKTENVTLDGICCKVMPEAQPGDFVRFSVADTGTGMDRRTIQHIFESFFTTKKPGKGTGLGLSVAYGIVQKHEGWISVHSKPGKGSTFEVYIPALTEPLEDLPSPPMSASTPGLTEQTLRTLS